MKVKLSELKLGDTVRMSGGSHYSDATVYRLNPDGSVQVWRPYVHTSTFAYTGGVIPYIGIEDFALHGADVERVYEAPEAK